jgi:hypothetical protein
MGDQARIFPLFFGSAREEGNGFHTVCNIFFMGACCDDEE